MALMAGELVNRSQLRGQDDPRVEMEINTDPDKGGNATKSGVAVWAGQKAVSRAVYPIRCHLIENCSHVLQLSTFHIS